MKHKLSLSPHLRALGAEAIYIMNSLQTVAAKTLVLNDIGLCNVQLNLFGFNSPQLAAYKTAHGVNLYVESW